MTHPTEQDLTIIARAEDAGLRLDVFISEQCKLSRAHVAKLIKGGFVTTFGERKKPSHVIVGNEIVVVAMPEPSFVGMEPEDIPLEIIFSDEHIAVINKPTGIVVHPGAGVKDQTLCNALLHHFPDMNVGNAHRPGIVHRLDKETSGIMVIAKTQEAHQKLSEDFKYRRVEKTYRVFCCGTIAETEFELKTGHMRHPRHRLKFYTKIHAPLLPNSSIRLAHTSFRVLGHYEGMTALKATLHTGRTHQIRAHLADIGHPLIGDFLYGGQKLMKRGVDEKFNNAVEQLRGQALHAEGLAFCHPITSKPLQFIAPLPEPLATMMKAFVK